VTGDRHIAPCPYDHRCDATLDDDDLRSFRIDGEVLIKEIAVASGIVGEPEPILPGVWHFGPLDSKRTIFGALSIVAATQPGLIVAMRASSRGQPMTLVAPPLPMAERQQFKQAGIHLVTIGDAIGCNNCASWALDTSRLAPETGVTPRLVICRAAKNVTLDGITKMMADQSFKLLVLLVEQALKSQAVVENRRIEGHLWGANVHRITSEVREPVRALRDALAADSADPKMIRSLIENRRNPNGYRLALAPEEIDLRP
jgi:hypothetical protein